MGGQSIAYLQELYRTACDPLHMSFAHREEIPLALSDAPPIYRLEGVV
jgi:hypothetical protein